MFDFDFLESLFVSSTNFKKLLFKISIEDGFAQDNLALNEDMKNISNDFQNAISKIKEINENDSESEKD